MALEFEGNSRYQPGRDRFMTMITTISYHHGNKALVHGSSYTTLASPSLAGLALARRTSISSTCPLHLVSRLHVSLPPLLSESPLWDFRFINNGRMQRDPSAPNALHARFTPFMRYAADLFGGDRQDRRMYTGFKDGRLSGVAHA